MQLLLGNTQQVGVVWVKGNVPQVIESREHARRDNSGNAGNKDKAKHALTAFDGGKEGA